MTKKLSLLFLICFLSALKINATVYSGSCGGDGIYTLDTETGVLNISGTRAMTNFYSLRDVPWYGRRSYIKKVEIVDGVTFIGDYAFYDCSSLSSIEISGSVSQIGKSAFSGCSGLNSITIPNSVTSIRESAFFGCSGLTSVTIPNSVTSIGNGAFSSCDGLISVTIPNSMKTIGEQVFNGCTGLTSIDIPNSVTSICERAFYCCYGLSSITIPNSVTSIGEMAFYHCNNLASIDVEDGNSIYNSLNKCNAIIETSSNKLILGCKNTTIPDGVTTIGDYAFSGCSGLTSITIPNSVTSIGFETFDGCSSLTSITIPNSVISIGNVAFRNCTNLISLNIPSSVNLIGSDAFFDCRSLTEIKITDIGAWCKIKFENPQSNPIYYAKYLYVDGKELRDLIVPNSVTSIGQYAFYNNHGISSVTIHEGVILIGQNTFSGCSKLKEVYCYADNVPSTNATAFDNLNSKILYVPDASIATYQTTAPWSQFGTIEPLSGGTPEVQKCTTPTITIVNGKIKFASETDGVEYVYNITPSTAISGSGDETPMLTKYTISVYAKKDGFENSDVATKEIDLGTSGIRGDLNGDGIVSMPDAMFIVNKILNGKFPDEK